MPHISSKWFKRPLINQHIAELINRGKLPKSLWPRVHVGPGGAYLLGALICLSAHGADSSSFKSSLATWVNPCHSCGPSKRLRLNSKAAALHQGPRIHTPCSARSILGLLMWKVTVHQSPREGEKSFQALPLCQNNNCTASRGTHQDPGHRVNLPAPVSFSVGGRLRSCSRAAPHSSKQIRLCGNNLQTEEHICCSPGAYRRLGTPKLLLL